MKRSIKTCLGMLLLALMFLLPAVIFPSDASAADPTTSLTVKKLAVDASTVIDERTVDYEWLEDNLPVWGDGVTHYYHQGPVFVNNADDATEQMLRWNSAENTNLVDMGAIKGTNVKDLCDLVGGMSAGETVRFNASDGLGMTFAYKNVYDYSDREGPMAICWYKDGSYPDSGYTDGMRLHWFADASVNPSGFHVFGNWDWHEAAELPYWYFYQSGTERYPTTTGLSVKYVSEIIIYSDDPVPTPLAPVAAFSATPTSGTAPLTVSFSDESTNTPASWAWDFNNDDTVDSTLQDPSYEYAAAGTYTVKLSVSNDVGNDEETKTGYITVSAAPTIDVLYDGTVDLTPDDTFDVTAYNLGGGTYAVDEATPLGALHATGLTYDVTDKNYGTSGALLLDNIGSYPYVKGGGNWLAYVNDVYKDGYNNAAGALNLIQLVDGDKVEFYYAAGISDKADLNAVKAAATAAVKTVANTEVPPNMDVLYDGTVSLIPDDTFDVTAYNLGGGTYAVDEATPLGALHATGLTYDVTDKNYGTSGALLLDNVSTYLRDKTNNIYWYAYVNDVYKDGYNNAAGALNLIELVDGDKVEFYYAANIIDPTDFNAVKAAATAAVKTVASTGVTPTDWTLQLTGAKDESVSKAFFEDGLACPNSGHQVFWTDDKGTPEDASDDDVWGGVPLWTLAGMVDDDPDVGPLHFNFNDDLAAQNYDITVVGGDGWSTTLDSAAIARSDGYIVANTLNGQPLPLQTEGGKPCWPLHLKGSMISGGQQVGNIVRIELSGLPEPPAGWTLEMLGQVGDTVTQEEFEAGLACTGSGHLVQWTDDKATPDSADDDVYSGVPLWVLLGVIDDIEMANHWTFNEQVVIDTPYTVKVTASDDFSRTFDGSLVANNNNFIVANHMNGVPLVSSYPLRLVGDGVTRADGTLGGSAVGKIAKIEILELQTPVAPAESWNLALTGKITDVMSESEFEAALACPTAGHNVEWTDIDGNVWSGMPLWFLTGWVDDRQPHEYNTTQALAGYTVLVKAGDGYSRGFASGDIAWSEDYIVANQMNGEPLDTSWPLRLVGPGVTRTDGTLSGSSVGNIVEIELTEFNTVIPAPELQIIKYDADLTTILDEETVDYLWMQSNLDVIGDGTTIYRYEGLTLQPDNLWDPEETYPGGFKIANAIKGTRIQDLCELVGGMGAGTEIELIASDGYRTVLPYSSIYPDPTVQARQGDAILAWYADGNYVPDYADGMRLFFTPDDLVYGQWDMHETLADNYWHYNYQDGVNYPSCAGLSTKNITTIKIYAVPASDWKLQLDGQAIGGMDYEVSKSWFETALGCTMGANHKASYTDADGHVWEGMPLWFLAGYVDDADQHSDLAFNDVLAQAGYRVVITAGDGYSTTIDSPNIIRSNNYIIANTLDGVPLAEDGSYWPLKLVGSAVSKKASVGQIASIELLPAAAPVAAFASDLQTGLAPLTVVFTNSSTGTAPLTYAWDFDNDGDVDSTDQNPSYEYNQAGTYSVKLTVTNDSGSDVELKTDYITVTPVAVAPVAAFSATPTSGTAPLTVAFTDESTGTASLSYAWDFDNDGDVDSTDHNPSYEYTQAGTYSVKLTVTNDAGSDAELKTDLIAVDAVTDDAISPQWRSARLKASDITETSLILTWTPATDNVGVTGYRIFIDGDLWDTVAGDTSSCLVEDLSAGTTYRFKVEAGDAAGNWTTKGPSARITTTDEHAPAWTDATLSAQTGRNKISLTWTAATDNVRVTEYRIYFNGKQVSKVSGNRTTCSISQGKLGSLHRSSHADTFVFTVQARDADGNWTSDGPSVTVPFH